MEHPLTPEIYDRVVSALTGNGELCTTLAPTGYHVPEDQAEDEAHQTQRFTLAGRRRHGPHHPLVDFGRVNRAITVDGRPTTATAWTQRIDVAAGAVLSEWEHVWGKERTRSHVALADNLFLADTILTNTSDTDCRIELAITYRFGDPDAVLQIADRVEGVCIGFAMEEQLGDIRFQSRAVMPTESPGDRAIELEARGATIRHCLNLAAGETASITSWVHFSDRDHFEFPITDADLDDVAARHEAGWRDFWQRSRIQTGDDLVDAFRESALYCIRCQATPWSVPPTLSELYWGGGAFHDELYPFFALLASNHAGLAARIPYFRLTTLPRARIRARGRGALYPWSSTEDGEERDPNGLWLTERFHLGQFAACIHALWLYERDRDQLDDLYPVLRDIARYVASELLERGADGQLHTRPCVDFDESAGPVPDGPFTVCAAIASLRYAAGAAVELGVDADRAAHWGTVAAEMEGVIHIADRPGSEVFAIPAGRPLHSAVLGPVFPFRVEVDSERARRTASMIHETCRSRRGWQPGLGDVFDGSSWMWTAGHLAAVHALQGSGDLAWEAIRGGALSAGPLLSPNEHVTSADEIRVPWFTTGCGAWLYALAALFVQVDEEGTVLLPAVPASLGSARFTGLRGHAGVCVSAALAGGRLTSLQLWSPRPQRWRFRIPSGHATALRVPMVSHAGARAECEVDLADGLTELVRS